MKESIFHGAHGHGSQHFLRGTCPIALWTFFFPQVFCFKYYSRVSLLFTYVLLWCFSISLIHTHAHTDSYRSLDFHSDPPVCKLMVSPVQCLSLTVPRAPAVKWIKNLKQFFTFSLKEELLADTQYISPTFYRNSTFDLSQWWNLQWQPGPCQQKEVVYKI